MKKLETAMLDVTFFGTLDVVMLIVAFMSHTEFGGHHGVIALIVCAILTACIFVRYFTARLWAWKDDTEETGIEASLKD